MTSKPSLCRRQRISIITDHPLAAESLQRLLQEAPKWNITTHSSASYASTLQVPMQDLEIVIFDKGATNICFPAHVRQIKQVRPLTRILVIDQPLAPDEECLLLYLGLHGFIPYGEVHRQLRPAIRAVMNGHLWFKPERLHNYVEYLSRRSSNGQKTVGDRLTQREQEIVDLIKRGLFTNQIGKELSISSSTVKFHVGNILSKLGLKHRREIFTHKFQDIVMPVTPGKVLKGTSSTGHSGIKYAIAKLEQTG